MRLNEGLFEDSSLYEIKGYYDSNFMGLEASDVAYDLDDAFEIAWEYLSNGDYVEIVDTDTGKRIVWEPDMLDEFDGEFPYNDMAKLMQKSVERNMSESMNRKTRKKSLKESLPREKRGPFFTDLYNAIADVIFKYTMSSWEEGNEGGSEPSKEDIESALDMFKNKFFESDYYKESFRGKPRRAINESESSFHDKVRFLNMVYQRHPADMEKWFEEHYPENPDIYLNDLTEEELDDIIDYLGLNFMRESIRRPRKKSLKESHKPRRTVNESLKEYIDFETLSDESLSLIEEGDHLVNGNEDWQILEIEVEGNRYLPKAKRTNLTVMNKNGRKMWATAKRFYGYKIVENGKAMNEDLEPEVIDEPEKAEITWVDDSGEQKVSTVELINKSFPETALKFSKEHGDCSIINCTAPLKGAQREDEPEKVALTESEETDGLANLISNEINGEFETTNGYRNLRQVASEVAPDMLPVIDDIMDEENTHVGQLQTLLSMVDDSADNIDVGAEEAEDQLEDEDVEIEHNDEVDVDFADIKKSDEEDADLEVKDDFDFDDEPFDEE